MTDNKITLLIDADDTLWENNIYFEKVIDHIIHEIQQIKQVSTEIVRDAIWKHEKATASKMGYGSRSFAYALKDVVREILEDDNSHHEKIFEIIDRESKKVYNHPINFFEGVVEHLGILKKKYRLILVTKGNNQEQSDKVDRSGVKDMFEHVEILPEKCPEAYQKVVDKYKLDKKLTWMIGNSPKSDINPAKSIGLNTILIPYHMTWHLEIEEVDNSRNHTAILKHFYEIDEYISKIAVNS